MHFNKLFANKIAFSAKVFFLALILGIFSGCQKKETQGHAPNFQLEWVGFSTQEKSGKLYVKRTGTVQENPKLQVRIPKGSSEKLTNRHAIVECDGHEILNRVDPITEPQLTYNFSKETMPLIRSLSRVSRCSISLRVFNEEGSSRTENLAFTVIQDSDSPYDLVDETPALPVVSTSSFQLRNFRIKNTSELGQRFFVRQGLNYELRKIFFFDPSQNGSEVIYRYSDDLVKATDYRVYVNDFEVSANDQGFFVFELQPQQEVRLVLTSSLPGGNCPADVIAGIRPGGLAGITPNIIPRHYKGALVHLSEAQQSFGQFEASNEPLSELITSRKALHNSVIQVGVSGVEIKALGELITPYGINSGIIIKYTPVLDDCIGILPDRLRN